MERHDAHDDDPLGPAGLRFPGEHEWLDLPLPETGLQGSGIPETSLAGFGAREFVDPAFVDRTMDALVDAGLAAPAPGTDDVALPPELLAAFASPDPSPDFVARTLAALQQDQARRVDDVLARYSAPEPSPEFVARTLAALAVDRGRVETGGAVPSQGPGPLPWSDARIRRWPWAVLAVAAGALVWLGLSNLRDRVLPSAQGAPFEVRLAHDESRAFAHGYATTPLGAVLTTIAHRNDPNALPDGDADAAWLLLGGGR